MKGLIVRLDREAACLPCRQAAFEEFDPQKAQGESSMQDDTTGFVTRARAINDRIFVIRDERRILNHFTWGKPLCARNDFGAGQQVERKANVEEKYILIGSKQGMETFWSDAILFHLMPGP